MKQTLTLTKQQRRIPISTLQFIASDNNYVMLSVKRSEQLQQLSNKTFSALASLRDKNAPIPAWAAKDPRRVKLFNQYGSPNVLNYFNPHVSIFDRDQQNTQLYKQLQQLIAQFSKTHQVKINATADAIGIGIADAQGQIVKELALFELAP
jgi:hypothetical protein